MATRIAGDRGRPQARGGSRRAEHEHEHEHEHGINGGDRRRTIYHVDALSWVGLGWGRGGVSMGWKEAEVHSCVMKMRECGERSDEHEPRRGNTFLFSFFSLSFLFLHSSFTLPSLFLHSSFTLPSLFPFFLSTPRTRGAERRAEEDDGARHRGAWKHESGTV
jgi:hypothetical protein